MALSKFKDALRDFRTVRQLKPNNRDALEKFRACEKEVKREAFEKAIHSEDSAQLPVSQTVDLSAIAVEESYGGPRLVFPLTHEAVLEVATAMHLQKKLHRRYVFELLLKAKAVLEALSSLVDVEVPKGTHINVCGDTHGQFYDLLHIFELHGYPSATNPYLFNGDFVDRGSFSVEVILLLLLFKVLYPQHMHLTRGNHETVNMNKVYGFEGEVKAKYSAEIFSLFTEVFQALPLGYVLGGQVLIVHGGLFSRDDVTLDEIRKIDRFCEPPDVGLMSEIMWSDPQPAPGRLPSKRGVGLSFGPDVTADFLTRNGLKLIVRSHELKDAGYEVEQNSQLVTVFSAPNYCDQMGNKGALLRFTSDMEYSIHQFDAVPHPPVRAMAYAGHMSTLYGL